MSSGPMRTDCSWCGRMICDGVVGAEGQTLNHGICLECARKTRRKYGLAPLHGATTGHDTGPECDTAVQSRQPEVARLRHAGGAETARPETGEGQSTAAPPPEATRFACAECGWSGVDGALPATMVRYGRCPDCGATDVRVCP